jgi:hypothetical protein
MSKPDTSAIDDCVEYLSTGQEDLLLSAEKKLRDLRFKDITFVEDAKKGPPETSAIEDCASYLLTGNERMLFLAEDKLRRLRKTRSEQASLWTSSLANTSPLPPLPFPDPTKDMGPQARTTVLPQVPAHYRACGRCASVTMTARFFERLEKRLAALELFRNEIRSLLSVEKPSPTAAIFVEEGEANQLRTQLYRARIVLDACDLDEAMRDNEQYP